MCPTSNLFWAKPTYLRPFSRLERGSLHEGEEDTTMEAEALRAIVAENRQLEQNLTKRNEQYIFDLKIIKSG